MELSIIIFIVLSLISIIFFRDSEDDKLTNPFS